jgi:hypothetical protein
MQLLQADGTGLLCVAVGCDAAYLLLVRQATPTFLATCMRITAYDGMHTDSGVCAISA